MNGLIGKIEITGKLTLLTGMHIGAGNAFSTIGAVDTNTVRDSVSKVPYIPGSSLKGKLRYLLSRANSKDDKVYEVAKYSAKDSDYLINQEVFNVFYKALKGKRILSHSGLFKEAMTKFKAGELEKYKEKDTTKYVYALLYNWGKKEYIEEERRLLTEAEQKEINGQLLDEMEVEEWMQ